jgi:hypothetical protein
MMSLANSLPCLSPRIILEVDKLPKELMDRVTLERRIQRRRLAAASAPPRMTRTSGTLGPQGIGVESHPRPRELLQRSKPKWRT